MNDEHEQDPPLDPDADARIRALLAELGTAPDAKSMPPEVAARLDATLARLVAERAEAAQDEGEGEGGATEESADVVPLRRRWRTRAAAAAAAVIVVGAGGVAAANLTSLGGGGAQSDSAPGGSVSKAESLDDSATPPGSSPVPQPNALSGGVPALSAASFDRDVARLLSDTPAFVPGDSAADKSAQRKAREDANNGALRATSCPGPRVTDGTVPLPVQYDGTPAVLLVHPERGGNRLVEAWSCSGDQRLDSARVPVVAQTSGQSSPGNPGLGSPSPSP